MTPVGLAIRRGARSRSTIRPLVLHEAAHRAAPRRVLAPAGRGRSLQRRSGRRRHGRPSTTGRVAHFNVGRVAARAARGRSTSVRSSVPRINVGQVVRPSVPACAQRHRTPCSSTGRGVHFNVGRLATRVARRAAHHCQDADRSTTAIFSLSSDGTSATLLTAPIGVTRIMS